MKRNGTWIAALVLAVVIAIAGWFMLRSVLFKSTPQAVDDSILRATDKPLTIDGNSGSQSQTPSVAKGDALPQETRKLTVSEADDESEGVFEDEGDEVLTPAEQAVKDWEDLTEKLQEADFTADTELSKRIKTSFDALKSEQDRLEGMQAMMILVSDGAVQSLMPILLDTSYSPDILDIIFSDIMNREDEIKYPILEEIVKNPEHPNFVDAAHVLEVTKPDEGPVEVDIEM